MVQLTAMNRTELRRVVDGLLELTQEALELVRHGDTPAAMMLVDDLADELAQLALDVRTL